ncbi:hypothetical protein DL767_008342 [Monosporascus sp. MG133]|nr:hypothetical protein DL767_008342 [Monosporascus sp. MG133]
MPVPNAAIRVWLEHTPDLDPDPTTGSRKRKRLAKIDLNANAAPRPMMPGDATTTAKRSVKRRQAGVARSGSDNDDNFDNDGGQPTPRPRATRAAEATATGGAYDTGSAAFADALRQNAPVLMPGASALAQTASSSRSTRSSPTRSRSSATSRGTGRAKSPIKTMADLSIAAKPPRLCSGREAPVPDDVRQLHAQLDLIQTGKALIPADVSDFFYGPNSQLRDWQIDTNPRSDAQMAADRHEVGQTFDIFAEAERVFFEDHTEPSWNSEVHSPLFRLALADIGNVRYFNMSVLPYPGPPRFLLIFIRTAYALAMCLSNFSIICSSRATISPAFVSLDDNLQSKLVDYSINLDPKPGSRADAAIRDTLRAQHHAARTLTPTMYPPVRMRPQAVAIETKTDKSSSEPLAQLCTWAGATFRRTRQLMITVTAEIGVGQKDIDAVPIITHPLVQACGHDWKLWYARDTPDEMVVHGPFAIGSTGSLLDTYKLVRSIRALGEWTAGPFRQWLEARVLGLDDMHLPLRSSFKDFLMGNRKADFMDLKLPTVGGRLLAGGKYLDIVDEGKPRITLTIPDGRTHTFFLKDRLYVPEMHANSALHRLFQQASIYWDHETDVVTPENDDDDVVPATFAVIGEPNAAIPEDESDFEDEFILESEDDDFALEPLIATGRIYPRRIIPWDDFAAKQEKLEYVTFLIRPISSKLGLRDFERDTVENAVRKMFEEVYKDLPLRSRLGLKGTITFESHTNLGDTDSAISEPMGYVSIGRADADATVPAPKKTTRCKAKGKGNRADQFCIYRTSHGQNVPTVAIEYKPPHKLSRDEIITGLKSEIQPKRDVIHKDGDGFAFASRTFAAAVVTQLFSYIISKGIQYGYAASYGCRTGLRLHTPSSRYGTAPGVLARHSRRSRYLAVEYDDVLRDIPATMRKEKRTTPYKPQRWKGFRRSPIRTRSSCKQPDGDIGHQRSDDKDINSGDGRAPSSPTPNQPRRSGRRTATSGAQAASMKQGGG